MLYYFVIHSYHKRHLSVIFIYNIFLCYSCYILPYCIDVLMYWSNICPCFFLSIYFDISPISVISSGLYFSRHLFVFYCTVFIYIIYIHIYTYSQLIRISYDAGLFLLDIPIFILFNNVYLCYIYSCFSNI